MSKELIFNFTNNTNFFWPIWSVPFCENVFIFWSSNMVTNFKSRIFSIKILIVFSIRIICNINRFHFNSFMNCYYIYQQNHWTHQNKHFWKRCHVFENLVFQCSNKSLTNNTFPFIVCSIHFNVIYFQNIFEIIIIKFTTLINPYFIWFSSFWDYFLKCVNNTNSFLSFIGITHAY